MAKHGEELPLEEAGTAVFAIDVAVPVTAPS